MTIFNKNTAIILFYVMLFYSISLTLGFFSSYVLSKKNYNFRFPLFITSMQNLIHFVLSSLYISFYNYIHKIRDKKKNIGASEEKTAFNLYESPTSLNESIGYNENDIQSNEKSISIYNGEKLILNDSNGIKNNGKKERNVVVGHPRVEQIIKNSNMNNKLKYKMQSEQNQIEKIKKTTLLCDNKDRGFLSDIPSYLITTLPCAITAAVDIGVSSHALRTVSLAFYTMIKSSAPVFVLLSGFLFGIEKPSISLFLTVFTIGSGVFLTTIKTDTVTRTINLCLSTTTFSLLFASFMAGFRWAFVQYLIEKRKVEKRSVLYTIKDLCLPIAIFLFSFSCYFEGIKNIVYSEFFQSESAIRRNIGFILLSGVLSFFLLVSEFLLVSKTSVVFLSVSGIIKELIIVFISVCRKDISFELVNYGGLSVSIIGLLLYNYMRLVKKEEEYIE